MNSIVLRLTTCLLSFLAIAPCSQAQTKWETGIALAATNYFGDFSPDNIVSTETHPAYGAYVRYSIHPAITFRLQYLRGRISGHDSNFPLVREERTRGFEFHNTISETATMIEWEPLAARREMQKRFRPGFSPYVSLGHSLLYHRPNINFHLETATNLSERVRYGVAMDKVEDEISPSSSLYFGIGTKLFVTKKLTFGIDIAARPTFTDYLDGLSQAANASNRDWFFSSAFHLAWRFYRKPADRDKDGTPDWKDKCPDEKGKRTFKGCPETADSDVAVEKTETPKPARKPVKPKKEKELAPPPMSEDYDGDRVPNAVDECPDVPGHVLFKGCPDSDGDGTRDLEDDCDDKPGPAANKGCPGGPEDKHEKKD